MTENNENIAREEILSYTDNLIRICQKHGVAVSGFVWGITPPILLSFGNTREQGDFAAMERLYQLLCETLEEKAADQNVIIRHADEAH